MTKFCLSTLCPPVPPVDWEAVSYFADGRPVNKTREFCSKPFSTVRTTAPWETSSSCSENIKSDVKFSVWIWKFKEKRKYSWIYEWIEISKKLVKNHNAANVVELHIKGHLISKAIYGLPTSSKKRTDLIWFVCREE